MPAPSLKSLAQASEAPDDTRTRVVAAREAVALGSSWWRMLPQGRWQQGRRMQQGRCHHPCTARMVAAREAVGEAAGEAEAEVAGKP